MPIFHMIAIASPIWLIKATDKLRRGFFWAQDEIASGGKCLVNWKSICRPMQFGGLGILNLKAQGIAHACQMAVAIKDGPNEAMAGAAATN